MATNELTHIAADGSVRMVDVSDKAITARLAKAAGRISASGFSISGARFFPSSGKRVLVKDGWQSARMVG